jgi:hypothetical protein
MGRFHGDVLSELASYDLLDSNQKYILVHAAYRRGAVTPFLTAVF